MATKKISELTAKGSNLSSTDLLEVSVDDGLGGRVSKSITGQEIIDAASAGGGGFFTGSTATADTTQDVAGFTFQITNAGVFIVDSTYAPSGVNGTFTLNGYGTTSADRVERITSDSGVLRESFGDKSAQHYGSNGFNTIPNGNGWIMVDSTGAGISGINVQGTSVAGIRSDVTSASCFVGNGQIGLNVNGSYAGVYTVSSGGSAIYSQGKAYFETYGVGTGPLEASAVIEINSTTQGFLTPRMTTTQRDAISTPATGLEIYNTTNGRKEIYNGSYWAGDARSIFVQSTSSSPSSGGTAYFGRLPKGLVTTAGISKVYIRKSGVIRIADLYSYSGTAGSNEAWSAYIRLNNTTDYLIATISSATNERVFNNSSMNIPVVAGDYFEIKLVNPTWGTSPLTTVFGGNIIIE